MIHPFFWLFAAIIGFLNSGGNLGIAFLWIVIVFFSILIHEYGHAVTALLFGKKPTITLVSLGGVTSYEPGGLSCFRQFLIVLNGPIAGFLLALGCYFLLYLDTLLPSFLVVALRLTAFINVFWTVVNLLPILPLDGGQLLRLLLEAWFGVRGVRAALALSMVLALGVSVWLFFQGLALAGMLLLLLLFENYQAWKVSSYIAESDGRASWKNRLVQAEELLFAGNTPRALEEFLEIRRGTKEGLIFAEASQYAGLLLYKEGRRKEAYDLLFPIHTALKGEARKVLHELAYEEENDRLVAELSSACFQEYPRAEVALITAKAYGRLGQGRFAGGWLKTAAKLGEIDVQSIAKDDAFAKVKGKQDFENFLKPS